MANAGEVEAVFSAIKRRLGSSLRGRTYHSQNRDMALMVLTYNIMLIWHAMKGFLRSRISPIIEQLFFRGIAGVIAFLRTWSVSVAMRQVEPAMRLNAVAEQAGCLHYRHRRSLAWWDW